MTIADRGNTIAALIRQIVGYESVINGNTFSPDTVDELKTSCGHLADDIKTEADAIKAEINTWS